MDWLRSMGGWKRPISYSPYEGKDHPKFTNFQDSIEKSPLSTDYTRHISLAVKVLKGIRKRRSFSWSWKTLSKIQQEEWFIKIEQRFGQYIFAMESGILRGDQRLIAEAILEVYCSLIIFSDRAFYRDMTEEDVLCFRIPLSKQSRKILFRGWVRKGRYNRDGEKLELDTLKFSIRAF